MRRFLEQPSTVDIKILVRRTESIEFYWWRRFYLAWGLVGFAIGTINATSIMMEGIRVHATLPFWRPLVTEYTGVFSVVVLIPIIRRFDNEFPFRGDGWRLPLLTHTAALLPVAALHCLIFIVARKLIFPLFGANYYFGNPVLEYLYELRKFGLGYFLVVCSLYGFRHYIQLRTLLDLPDANEPVEDTGGAAHYLRRVVAKRNGREYIVNVAQEVDYFESAGNYVVIHTGNGPLKLRTSLTTIEDQLNPDDFVRIHRSLIVNLGAIKEIQPWFHGDQKLVLNNGALLNLSRRYRDEFTKRISSLQPAFTLQAS